ncbi:hypothetical protein BJX66DRAFT_341156 [Aspergillus keveii]|uniref:Clavaminate synthase-like protein n=1 Tax=Aspergillus keveii TaxID=714993 RepID=A0ABR4FX37_9EURO
MATASIVSTPLALNTTTQDLRHDSQPQSTSQSITLLGPDSNPPDHLYTHHADAASLNATYPRRGILKTAATTKTESDQKFTLDFSSARNARFLEILCERLPGLEEILGFFDGVVEGTAPAILKSLGTIAGVDVNDFADTHKSLNMNFRLCDYNPVTAAPESENGCGAHTDYGTFTIIKTEQPDWNSRTLLRPEAGVPSPATQL